MNPFTTTKSNKMKNKAWWIALFRRAHENGLKAMEGMFDQYPCGGAWLVTNGRSELVRAVKKYGEKTEAFDTSWELGKAVLSKGVRGYTLSLPFAPFQSVAMCNRYYEAVQETFARENISVGTYTYID